MRKFTCKSLILTTLLTLTSNAFSCDIHGHSGIVAENNLKIPVGLKAAGGITEQTFNKVIDRVASLYSQEVKQKGASLVFERNWTDPTVNAHARRDDKTGKIWYIAMFGGLARHPTMTEDGFAIVVCHELGHQIGGAPKKIDPTAGSMWASNEGQADYFATLKCLRNYFAKDRNVDIVKKIKVPTDVATKCSNSFANAEEVAICERSAMAGLTMGNFFRVLSNQKTMVAFSTPDKNVVKKTDDNHPMAQCRLDTYYQGSLCDKSVSEKVSDKDENIGTCTKRNGDEVGLRPLCWFKPKA